MNRQRWSLSGTALHDTPAVAERVLTLRELNRALLARQLLLKRARLPVARAIERRRRVPGAVVTAPYVALWTRLGGVPDHAARAGAGPPEQSRQGDAACAPRSISCRAPTTRFCAAAVVDARPAYSVMHARLVHLPPSGTYSFRRGAHSIPYEEWVGAASNMPHGADAVISCAATSLPSARPR